MEILFRLFLSVFPSLDVNVGEAHAAPLAINLVKSYDCNQFSLFRRKFSHYNSAIKKAKIFSDWNFASIIEHSTATPIF
jgi:hypothetical protein